MNLQEIRYSDVQKDDTLFIKTEKNKKGEPVKVVEVENWQAIGGHCYKITFENKDEWYGWGDRILMKV